MDRWQTGQKQKKQTTSGDRWNSVLPSKKKKTNLSELFTKKDPAIIGETLKNLLYTILPGTRYGVEEIAGKGPSKDILKKYARLPIEAGKDVVHLAKGLPGFLTSAVATPTLSASEALGGPSKANLGLLGEQSSFQEKYRELRGAGAGQATSTAIPAGEYLMSFLGGKHLLSKAKGALGKGKAPIEAPTEIMPKDVITEPKKAGAFGLESLMKGEKAKNFTSIKDLLTKTKEQSPLEAGAKKVVKAPLDDISISKSTSVEKILQDIDKSKVGLQGKVLNETELNVLKEYLNKTGSDELRGTVYKPYGGGRDVVFGTIKDRQWKGQTEYLVMNDSGAGKGRFRLHSTPITEADIISRPSKVQAPLDDISTQTTQGKMPRELMTELPKEIADAPVESTNIKYAVDTLKRAREFRKNVSEREIPKEAKTVGEKISEQVKDMTTEPTAEKVIEDVIKKNPKGGARILYDRFLANMDERIASNSKAGADFINRYHNAIAGEGYTRGSIYLKAKGFPKLLPKEQSLFIDVVEGKKTTNNPKVLKAVELNRELAETIRTGSQERGFLLEDSTGMPITTSEGYVPHRLNDAGRLALKSKPNTFFKEMAKANKMSEGKFRKIWENYINPSRVVKAGFEHKRLFNIPQKYMETNPNRIWSEQGREYARRATLAEEFGANYEDANRLIEEIGEETGNQSDIKLAKDFFDTVTGRATKDWEANAVVSNLIQRSVHTKLTPLQALPNMAQGTIVNSVAFGQKYNAYGTVKAFTKGGKAWAERIGVLGEGFYSDYKTVNKAWGRVSGFPLTEDFNFIQVANGSKLFLEDMYKKVKKNPNDKYATQQLDYYKVKNWKKTLKNGAKMLSEEQLARGSFTACVKGIFPKISGMIPEWANNPVGRATYLFGHYQLQQPKFLASQFKFGTARGLKALATAYIVGGIMGEVPADFNALVRQEDRPENPFVRFSENAFTVTPPGWIYNMVKTAVKYGSFGFEMFPMGGAILGGPIGAGKRAIKDIVKSPEKLPEDVFRSWLRGDVPVGPYVPSGSLWEKLLFPPNR